MLEVAPVVFNDRGELGLEALLRSASVSSRAADRQVIEVFILWLPEAVLAREDIVELIQLRQNPTVVGDDALRIAGARRGGHLRPGRD